MIGMETGQAKAYIKCRDTAVEKLQMLLDSMRLDALLTSGRVDNVRVLLSIIQEINGTFERGVLIPRSKKEQ